MKKVISILLVVAMLSCFMASAVSAAEAGTASIKVATVTVNKGENATVSVSVSNNPGYRSFAMALNYDASKLEVVSVGGDVVSNTRNPGVVYVSFASATLVEDNGEMFSVTFKTKHDCAKAADVTVTVEELFTKGANNAAQKVPYTTTNGSVAINHTVVTLAAKEPTCTETGLTEGSACSVCGKVFEEQKVIPALGHDFAAEYKYDDAQHWHVCVRCNALSAKEDHAHNELKNGKLYCVCGHSIPAPTEPTQPDVTDPSTPAPGDDDEPETGDITGLIVFGVVAVVAMAGAVAYTVKRKFAK